MIDALRSYLQLASGMAEVSAVRARETAAALVAQANGLTGDPEDIKDQLGAIAVDLMEQSKTNREIITGLIKTEVDRNVGRMGFVREEELAALRRHVQRLEAQLPTPEVARNAARSAAETAKTAAATAASAARSAPKLVGQTGSTTAAAPEPVAEPAAPAVKTTVAARPGAQKAPAKKTAAKKAPAKKAPAKKASAKKAAKKAPAKK